MIFNRFIFGMIIVLFLLFYINSSYSLSDDFFYPPDSIVNGSTYYEWSIKYWEWQVSVPNSIQPTNEKCIINNEYPVLFLGNPIYAYELEDNFFTPEDESVLEYECTIPSNKPIYIHGMSEICKLNSIFESIFEDKPNARIATYDDLLKCVNYRNWAAQIDIQVDDRKIIIPVDEKNLLTGEIIKKSEFSKLFLPFNITVPENSFFLDLGTGTDTALLDTKSVILKPLPIGDHVIRIDVGQRIKNQPLDTLDLSLKYILHVK
jgi:hypothetical protein